MYMRDRESLSRGQKAGSSSKSGRCSFEPEICSAGQQVGAWTASLSAEAGLLPPGETSLSALKDEAWPHYGG
jgi:hypothetical protein